MQGEVYSYQFKENVPIREVEDSLMLAVLATESVFGRSQVHLDARFHLDKENHSCIVDAGNEVGRNIARIFTGFLTKEFGEEAFQIQRFINEPTNG